TLGGDEVPIDRGRQLLYWRRLDGPLLQSLDHAESTAPAQACSGAGAMTALHYSDAQPGHPAGSDILNANYCSSGGSANAYRAIRCQCSGLADMMDGTPIGFSPRRSWSSSGWPPGISPPWPAASYCSARAATCEASASAAATTSASVPAARASAPITGSSRA